MELKIEEPVILSQVLPGGEIEMTSVVERFLKYVSFDTQSIENAGVVPSSPGQMDLAREVVLEMEKLEMTDVSIDENAYVMGTLPGNMEGEDVPSVGFIAHFDTAREVSGLNVRPRIVRNYDGGDILLNREEKIVLSPRDFPELMDYKGQDIIVTDGTTLLGADDKAGMAIILAAVQFLNEHPEISHGPMKVCFTPDEEIGHQARLLDIGKFGADFAYTVDGGALGDLNYMTFNAAKADILIHGRNVHPGKAKGKMINSVLVGMEFMSMLPPDEIPAMTEDFEGFYHILSFKGDVEKTELNYIIRDHDMNKFKAKKARVEEISAFLKAKYGDNVIELNMEDQYYNMSEHLKDSMHIVETAEKAMISIGVEPRMEPVRGGTDGASLSARGLITPNIFTGGHNFHGRFEYIPIPSMEKGVELVVKILELYGEKKKD